MKSEAVYDPVSQALDDIRKSLDERIRFLNEQINRAQRDSLMNAFHKQKEALAECLDGIDQQLLTLSVYFEEYQRLHQSLRNLNEKRIPELGGTAPAMPQIIAGNTLVTVWADGSITKSQRKIVER